MFDLITDNIGPIIGVAGTGIALVVKVKAASFIKEIRQAIKSLKNVYEIYSVSLEDGVISPDEVKRCAQGMKRAIDEVEDVLSIGLSLWGKKK